MSRIISGLLAAVYMVRNPEKLAHVGAAGA
jgi:hypothetical protein